MHEDVLDIKVKDDLALAQRLHKKRPENQVHVQVIDTSRGAQLSKEALLDRVFLKTMLVDMRSRSKPEAFKIRVDVMSVDAIDGIGRPGALVDNRVVDVRICHAEVVKVRQGIQDVVTRSLERREVGLGQVVHKRLGLALFLVLSGLRDIPREFRVFGDKCCRCNGQSVSGNINRKVDQLTVCLEDVQNSRILVCVAYCSAVESLNRVRSIFDAERELGRLERFMILTRKKVS